MKFDKFLSLFDKQWHSHPDNKNDKISQLFNINKELTVGYFFVNTSMWLEYIDSKSKRTYRLTYSLKDNIVCYDQWKSHIWNNVDEVSWKFPLSSTEEEFFMNTTLYDGGKYCTLYDMQKVQSIYKKVRDIIFWGRK